MSGTLSNVSRCVITAIVVVGGAALPLWAGKWINITANLKGIQGSACGNLCSMDQVPGKDKIIVGTASAGLYASTNGGASWDKLGTGAGSDQVNDKPYCITFDHANSDIFWVTGQYGSWGVYKTTDGGVTFHHLGLTDGASGQNNIDFSDPLRQTLVVGTIEENPTRVWRSTDGGTTWTNIGATLPAGVNFTYNVTMLNTLTYIVSCTGWGTGTNGIYRTTDGAATWKLVCAQGGREPALIASDSTFYWALSYNNGLLRSTDRGVTWTQPTGYNVITDNSLIEIPDHRLVAIGVNKRLKVSADKGAHWADYLDSLPIQPISEGRYAVVYNDVRNAFFISQWNCTEPLPDSLVWRYDCDGSEFTSVKSALRRDVAQDRSSPARSFVLTGDRARIEPGTVCTIDGRRLSSTPGEVRSASRRSQHLLIVVPAGQKN